MHAIAPVVLRVGGDVDALGVGVLQSDAFVDGEPVLQREDAQHGGRGQLA